MPTQRPAVRSSDPNPDQRRMSPNRGHHRHPTMSLILSATTAISTVKSTKDDSSSSKTPSSSTTARTLTPEEEFWKGKRSLLASRGFRLRRRFQSGPTDDHSDSAVRPHFIQRHFVVLTWFSRTTGIHYFQRVLRSMNSTLKFVAAGHQLYVPPTPLQS